MTHEREHQGKGLFRCGERVRAGRIEDHDAGIGCGRDVDRVDSDAGSRDDRQVRSVTQQLAINARLRAHDQSVGFSQRSCERFGFTDARNYFDTALAQNGETALGEWFGNDDAGGGEAGSIGGANHELSTMRRRFDGSCALEGWLAFAGPAALTH